MRAKRIPCQLPGLSVLAFASLGLHAGQPDRWITPAEASHFQTTPNPETSRAHLHQLAQAARQRLQLETIGRSP